MMNKYRQVHIFIHCPDTGKNCIPLFYLTLKPSPDEIDDKLYSMVLREKQYVTYQFEDALLDTCDTLPIIHQNQQ